MQYMIMTYGCQMNENDSEKLKGILNNLGYSETNIKEDAHIILMNTCSVRENANDKFFGNLGMLKNLKKKNKDLIIGVCGCMMQEEHIINTLKEKYPYVDLVFGTHNIHNFPLLLEDAKKSRKTIIEVLLDEKEIIEDLPIKREFQHKALVTIMNGCDNFCSYCIVPYTRGREKSRDINKIIEEITLLAKEGCSEITLLGQNVNSYGKGLDEGINFALLLRKVNEIKGIKRIRFMTNHPKDLSDDVILAIKECENVCKHIHLPLQSGSNRILSLMNRKYTKEEYLLLVKKIRETIKDVAITTDIIVGFPTEREEDFLDTLDVMEKANFDLAFTYIYSPRVGTKAEKMEGRIPEEVIKKRFKSLLELHDSLAYKQNLPYRGKTVEVLIDGVSKNNEEVLTGRTSTSKIVNFKGKGRIGEYKKIKIVDVKSYYLIGEEI